MAEPRLAPEPLDEERRSACERLVEGLSGAATPELALVHRSSTPACDRVGVLAASFNPPTWAHLRMAEIAHGRHGLAEVLLELSIANVDKHATDAPLSDRLMMMLALAGERPWLSVALATHARFVDKAAAIRHRVAPAEIVFIVGTDTLVRVFDDKYYADRDAELSQLFSSCTFLCANRAGSRWDDMRELLARPGNRRFAGGVERLVLDARYESLSSSAVRASVRQGATDLPQVPAGVASYIRERALYQA